jgi:homoserine dehydrogenase
MRKCKIGILGFGTVGSGIYKILNSKVDSHPILKEIEIVKIAVKDLKKKKGILS